MGSNSSNNPSGSSDVTVVGPDPLPTSNSVITTFIDATISSLATLLTTISGSLTSILSGMLSVTSPVNRTCAVTTGTNTGAIQTINLVNAIGFVLRVNSDDSGVLYVKPVAAGVPDATNSARVTKNVDFQRWAQPGEDLTFDVEIDSKDAATVVYHYEIWS